jgi:hypothetical protein
MRGSAALLGSRAPGALFFGVVFGPAPGVTGPPNPLYLGRGVYISHDIVDTKLGIRTQRASGEDIGDARPPPCDLVVMV